MTYKEVVAKLAGSELLTKQLDILYNAYLTYGMVIPEEFVEDEFNPTIVLNHKLVEQDSTKKLWHILPTNLFAYVVLKAKVATIDEAVPRTFNELNEHYEKAISRPINRFSGSQMHLEELIMEVLLRAIFEKVGEIDRTWILNLQVSSFSKIRMNFIKAYCSIADGYMQKCEDMIDACKMFLSWGIGDMLPRQLLTRYVAKNWDEAYRVLKMLSSEDNVIRSSILAGLYQGDSERGWQVLQEVFANPTQQMDVITAVHFLPIPDTEGIERIIDFILSYDRSHISNRSNIPHALMRLMGEVNFDTICKSKCFHELNELAKYKDLETTRSILSALRGSSKSAPVPTMEVLLTLLANPVITHEHIGKLNQHPNFDDVLQNIDDLDLLFDFFDEYARRHSEHFSHDTFYFTINGYIESSSSTYFREKVLGCLVHDEGSIRMFGNGILDFYRHYNHKFEFHINIAQLPPIVQYKLWMSVLLPYKQPKVTIPFIIDLLRSEEPIVAEAFLCKLEEMTESYFEEIIKVVEELYLRGGENDSHIEDALKRLKSYYTKFCEMIDSKNSIQEFKPFVSQAGIYSRFNELQRYKMNEQINAGMEKSGGLLTLFKKVTLAKGGGWKLRNKESISKLGHIQSSVIWPRHHLLDPEEFEWNFRKIITSNWYSDKTDFIEWLIE